MNGRAHETDLQRINQNVNGIVLLHRLHVDDKIAARTKNNDDVPYKFSEPPLQSPKGSLA